MRLTFVTGLSISSLAFAAVALSLPSAKAQQPAHRFPAPRNGAGAAYMLQFGSADQGTVELAQLGAQDSQLANEAESLAKQLADATDEKQKAELKEKLHDTLSRQFDAQQKARELEVARIEAKVKKLRDTIAKRNDGRRTIIDKRFDQLLSETEGLGWNSPPTGSGFGPFYAPQAMNPGTRPAGNPPRPNSPRP